MNSKRNTASQWSAQRLHVRYPLDRQERTPLIRNRQIGCSEVTLTTPDAVFLVDGMGYLTALTLTDLNGHLNYTERNVVEKLFQTYTMRIERFHETWNGSQASAGVIGGSFEYSFHGRLLRVANRIAYGSSYIQT